MNKLILVSLSNIKNKVEDILNCIRVYFYKSPIFNCFIRAIVSKVPDKLRLLMDYSLKKATSKNPPPTLKWIILLITVFQYIGVQCYGKDKGKDSNQFVFLMVYETNKPLTIKKSVLYFSENKWFTQKKDSLVINYNQNAGVPDTIIFIKSLNKPAYLNLKVYFTDHTLASNTIYFASDETLYDAVVDDSALRIRPKIAGNNLSNPNPIQGFALIITAILEMILAWLISKAFGLSRQVILMVLAANIAVFPLYLIHFPSVFLKEASVFAGKAIVMVLIGLRKMPKYQILLLLISLTIIVFGFKQLFFFLSRIF